MVNERILPDGTTDFSGGQNAAIEPDQLPNNQFHIGVNISVERACVSPRWGIVEQPLDFTPAGDYTRASGFKVPFEEVFLGGKFQGFAPYSIGPDYFNLYIVSGFIFIINLQDFTVDVLNKTDQLNVNADRVNWSNAGEFFVIYDWPNNPFILDGIQIRRADPTKFEVPVSVLGAYNQNRLCIANAGIDWTAGDPAGSPATPDAPITFIEVLTPSTGYTGDVYQLPTAVKNNDVITAMGFLQVLDKSTEIGSLIVASANSIYSYPTFLPRVQWQGGNDGRVFGSILLNTGIAGQRAQTNVNSDFIFLNPEGQLYSVAMARDEFRQWSNSPISREVENFLGAEDAALSFVAACGHFKNKIFCTCNPYRVDVVSSEGVPQTDFVSSGVVVIETDNRAGLTNKKPPVWAGVWTGVQFMDMAENNKIFYVAAKHNNRNGLFIFDPLRTYDFIDGKPRDVRSVLVTKEYENTDGTVNKELNSLDLGFRDIEEKLNITVHYKPDTSGIYNIWRENICFMAPVEQCDALPKFPNGLTPQGVRDMNIGGVDPDVCNIGTDEYMHVYKGVQLRLIITGRNWKLKYLKLRGLVLPENILDFYCNEDCKGVPIPVDCFDIWEIPKGDC